MFGSNMLTGLALGAGAMYFFDAHQGRRRRKLVADQINHLGHQFARDLDASWRDLSNRTQGTIAQARSLVAADEATDDVLCQRVRSNIGRHVAHPAAIEVSSQGGHVTLHGHVLSHEVPGLLAAIGQVRGVRTVSNELSAHDDARNFSPLQGGRARRARSSYDFIEGNWSPSTKLVAGTLGAALLGNCLTSRHRTPLNFLLGTAGFGLLAQSLMSASSRQAGRARGATGVEFHKTLEIAAPLDKVFDFFSKFENLMLISNTVQNVRDHGNGVFSKTIGMPGGIGLHLCERITCFEKNDCFATRSEPDSMIRYSKQVSFESTDENHTRLHLQFCYHPPGGRFGHSAAAALGLDAKSFFDDLMMRAKTYLETGVQPHDAARRMFGHGHPRAQPARRDLQPDFGTNAPTRDVAPGMAGMAGMSASREADQIGPIERDLTEGQVGHAEIRSHI